MSTSAITRTVTLAMTKLMEEGKVLVPNDLTRVQKVRFSGLPFCGVKWFLNLPQALSKAVYKEFGFSYFTSVGTTVHEVIQKVFLSVEDVELLMDWKCRGCGHIHELVDKKPSKCPKCGGTEHTHEEHTVNYKGALGHIDQMIRFKFGGKIWIIIIDYKTCTLRATESNSKFKSPLPYPSNVAQIKGYCGAMRSKGHPIMGYALVYVPRDAPFQFVVKAEELTDAEMEKEGKWIEHYVDVHRQWMDVKTWEDVVALADERPCAAKKHKRYADCDHVERCAGDDVGCHSLLKDAYQKVQFKLPVKDIKPEKKEEHGKQKPEHGSAEITRKGKSVKTVDRGTLGDFPIL